MTRIRMCFAMVVLGLVLVGLGRIGSRRLVASQATPTVYSGSGPAPGSTTVPAIRSALEAIVSMHSGTSAPSYLVTGTLWYDTTNDLVKLYDGSAWIAICRVNEAGDVAAEIQGEVAFADADATPSVKGVVSAKTANTGGTTITGFDDGVAGQILTLRIADANTTIDAGLTATGMTIPGVSGDTLQWIYDGAAWKQIGGSIGMGRFVSVDPVDEIGDWIASSVTAYTDVDVSNDGVRKGACAVKIRYLGYSSNADAGDNLYVRANGSADAAHIVTQVTQNNTASYGKEFTVELDANGVFEAKFTGTWTSTDNNAAVVGYWI